jgi:hypothetical protein
MSDTIDIPNVADPSLNIDGFCAAEHISRGLLYKSWREGWGPEFYWAGTTRRITHRARIAWHQKLEAAARAREAETADT